MRTVARVLVIVAATLFLVGGPVGVLFLVKHSTVTRMCENPSSYRTAFDGFDYLEQKDLLKTFLTLQTGVLVASITFAEKIVGISQVGRSPRLAMFSSWMFFLLSIVLSGTALGINFLIGTSVRHDDLVVNICGADAATKTLGGFAGLSFVTGLAALVGAGILGMLDGRPATTKAEVPAVSPDDDGTE